MWPHKIACEEKVAGFNSSQSGILRVEPLRVFRAFAHSPKYSQHSTPPAISNYIHLFIHDTIHKYAIKCDAVLEITTIDKIA